LLKEGAREMVKFVLRMWDSLQETLRKGNTGQTLEEYLLIMSAIAIAVIVTAVISFRGSIIDAFS
jgi:hypothetical protein